jgi:hypothetical protein
VKSIDSTVEARSRRAQPWKMQLARVECGTETPCRVLRVTMPHRPGQSERVPPGTGRGRSVGRIANESCLQQSVDPPWLFSSGAFGVVYCRVARPAKDFSCSHWFSPEWQA